ncbi:hypothetical protein M9H77_22329 [Catharanthus roseus]|uniref:Uncharacterized protein n=1 Tax=Catharanthus roseus TaxID=4058 RepID=A0ACC0AQV1_CATRO|nr:hypothetical protein M9H77_22329 [Catharanthus roseus]
MKMKKRSNRSPIKKRKRKSFNRSPIPKYSIWYVGVRRGSPGSSFSLWQLLLVIEVYYSSRDGFYSASIPPGASFSLAAACTPPDVYSSSSIHYALDDLDSIFATAILESGTHVYSFGFIYFNKQSDCTKVPDRMKNMWSTEFEKRYRWDPMHEHAIWDAWHRRDLL